MSTAVAEESKAWSSDGDDWANFAGSTSQYSGASSQSSNRPGMEGRSYSRELLAKFLLEEEGASGEGAGAGAGSGSGSGAKPKKSKKKKKKSSKNGTASFGSPKKSDSFGDFASYENKGDAFEVSNQNKGQAMGDWNDASKSSSTKPRSKGSVSVSSRSQSRHKTSSVASNKSAPVQMSNGPVTTFQADFNDAGLPLPHQEDFGDDDVLFDEDDEDVIEPDEMTVQSDITGLTGVFSGMPVGHRHDGSDEDEIPTATHTSASSSFHAKAMEAKPMPKSRQPAQRRAKNVVKNVRFHSVQVRDYERILGINPACTSGPPLSLGWRFSEKPTMSLEEYESNRPDIRKRNRELILGREERENILLRLGYTQRDLAVAVRQTIRSKNRRKQTVNNLAASGVEETLEGAGRAMKKFLFGKKKVAGSFGP